MTERPMSLGEWIACGAVGLALLGAAVGSGLAASDDGPPQAVCTRLEPGWTCTFPTPGRTARVVVHAFEDGSAQVRAIDPDGR